MATNRSLKARSKNIIYYTKTTKRRNTHAFTGINTNITTKY